MDDKLSLGAGCRVVRPGRHHNILTVAPSFHTVNPTVRPNCIVRLLRVSGRAHIAHTLCVRS